MIKFPRSRVVAFYNEHPNWRSTGETLGKVFTDWAAATLILEDENDLAFVVALQEADSLTASRMIINNTDWSA